MGLPGEKDRVQPLSWKSTQHPTHHHHHRPTQGQDRCGLTGGGGLVQIPHVPVLPDLAAVTQLSEGPTG